MKNNPAKKQYPLDKPKGTNNPTAAWKKRTAGLSRWLHIYLSMFSFVIVLFFALTGITLNHADWFDGKQVEHKFPGQVPVKWVNTTDTALVKKMEIVEFIRKTYHISGLVNDFFTDDLQCSVSFKGPGYSADAFINRKSGVLKLTEVKLGVVAILNDLHKGRDSGKTWAWLIDASAIFLSLVSITGLVMILLMKKRSLNGLLTALVGGIICYLLYHFFVG